MHENNWKNSVCVYFHTCKLYDAHTYHIATWVQLRRWDVKLLILYSGFCLLEFIFLFLSLVVTSRCWLATQATDLQLNRLWFFSYFTYESCHRREHSYAYTFNCDTRKECIKYRKQAILYRIRYTFYFCSFVLKMLANSPEIFSLKIRFGRCAHFSHILNVLLQEAEDG